ncbi:hypothetical protein UCMB321_4039 [Pseudomonas batumici]|uniref:Chorismate mutase n=1 Tax=Pseudomonas batumici TaxID=226910 RepID=A0A0C2ETY0_9PSED|nr:hypothetical protein UCMB321_4039 [Pseudomonas batumici]
MGCKVVRALSEEYAANPDVVEQVYRAMIAAFIEQELQEHGKARHLSLPT